MDFIEPCFGIGHNLSLICQMTSEDIKHKLIIIIIGLRGLVPNMLLASEDIKQKQNERFVVFIVQELCESRGGRPGLSVLTSLLVFGT